MSALRSQTAWGRYRLVLMGAWLGARGLTWADGALRGDTQVVQLSVVPEVQQACRSVQQPIAIAATATPELHNTAPNSNTATKRCK
jgi:hypothetical protein